MYTSKDIDASTSWHHKLGHISEKRYIDDNYKGRILNMKNVSVDFCDPCILTNRKGYFYEDWSVTQNM